MILAYIGLGSNLNHPKQQIATAIRLISQLPDTKLILQSSLYLNPPYGFKDQPDFINAVVSIETKLSAKKLLATLNNIELQQGRIRTIKNGPRAIDCDLLLYGDHIINTEQLTVPHPELTKRAFVVIPLYEIAPKLILPNGDELADYIAEFRDKLEQIA